MNKNEIWSGQLTTDAAVAASGLVIHEKAPRKKLSEEECISIGGHCWNEYSANEGVDEFGNKTGFYYTVYFPDGEPLYRTCKHCGKRQKKEPVTWVDK